MRRIAWTKDKPNALLIEDSAGSTEVALRDKASVGDADAALDAHSAALEGRATGDVTVVVREQRTR